MGKKQTNRILRYRVCRRIYRMDIWLNRLTDETTGPEDIGCGTEQPVWQQELFNLTWHNGATGCFRSFVGFREDGKSGVVLLENHQERNETNLDVVGKEILGRMV